MSLTNFPNGITSFGMPVMPTASAEVTTGDVYFVHSGTGTDAGGNGRVKSSPFATIDYAIGNCTANKGDVIYVMPGHAESISGASAIALDVAGVSVIGLGRGAARPTLTYGSATTTIAISGANCAFKNMILNANYADVAVAIIASGVDVLIEGCLFKEAGTNLNFLSCIATSAVANAADGLSIIGNERISIDAAALAFVSILEATNRLKIIGNFDNQASAADVGHFLIMGAFVCLGAQIVGNVLNLNGDNNAQTVGVFATGSSTSSTGVMAYNLVGQLDATTELFDTATLDFHHFQNFMTGTIAKSGYVLPAIDS